MKNQVQSESSLLGYDFLYISYFMMSKLVRYDNHKSLQQVSGLFESDMMVEMATCANFVFQFPSTWVGKGQT
jgi:hypothetical protein